MESQFPTFRRLLTTSWSDLTFAWPWYTTHSQSQALLRLIVVAIEENLPLSSLLESWAADERGVQKWRLRRLARLLAAGRALPDALEEVPDALSEQDLLAIRFDAKLGLRAAALREALQTSPSGRDHRHSSVKKTLVYFAVVLAVGLFTFGLMQIHVVPALHMILMSHSMAEPAPLQWSHYLAHWLAAYFLPGAALLLLALWIAFATQWGALLRRSVFSRLRGPWNETVSADVLQKLALAASAGRPLEGALSLLARYHFDPLTRNKLLFARNEVEQGIDVWQSLTSVGLLAAPELQLLETAERIGNRPWALIRLADLRKRRALERRDRWAALLLPVLTVAMGTFVLFQALTVFVPLVELLYQL